MSSICSKQESRGWCWVGSWEEERQAGSEYLGRCVGVGTLLRFLRYRATRNQLKCQVAIYIWPPFF